MQPVVLKGMSLKQYLLFLSLFSSGELLGMNDSLFKSPKDFASPKQVDIHKQKALRNAILAGSNPETEKASLEAIKALLHDNIDINYRYREHEEATPLLIAIETGNISVIRLLLAVPGIDVLSKRYEGDFTSIQWCISYHATGEPLKTLLDCMKEHNLPFNLNMASAGQPLLSFAILKGNVEAVKLLCQEAQVNPNTTHEFNGNTPLHTSAERWIPNQVAIIRLLVDKGAKIDSTNHDGQTPLALAFSHLKNGRFLDYNGIIGLLAPGASKSPTGKADFTQELKNCTIGGPSYESEEAAFLNTCFHEALQEKDTLKAELRLFMLPSITNPNIKDRFYGMTALMWAAALGHPTLAKLLFTHPKIEINTVDNQGETALHYAARNGHATLVRLLLEEANALPSIQNAHGKTPRDLAEQRDHKQICLIFDHHKKRRLLVFRVLATPYKGRLLPILPADVARLIINMPTTLGEDQNRLVKILELCTSA